MTRPFPSPRDGSSQPVMRGGNGHEAPGGRDLLISVEPVETVQKFRQGGKIRWGMLSHLHHKIAQFSWLEMITMSGPRGGPMLRFGEAGVKLAMQPAEKIGRIDIHLGLGQLLFHELFHRQVRQAELLIVALPRVVREIAFQCPFDVAWDGFMAFNQVGVIAIHRPDQVRHPLEHQGRMHLTGYLPGGFEKVAGQFGQPASLLLGKQRFHRPGMPVKFHNLFFRKCFLQT